MQIFIVTSGCYSDYCVNGVFSSKELAQDYIDRMEFCSDYDEYYNIQQWEVDKIPTEIPTNDFCLFNNEIIKLDDLFHNYGDEGYIAYCVFENNRENLKSRVLEITKEDYLNGLLDNDWGQDEIDINTIQFPIYCVLNVKYNKDKSVIEKVVHDEIVKYKAEKEGL